MQRTASEIAERYFQSAKNKCNAHFRVAQRKKWQHRQLGIISTIVSAIVGTSVFVSISKSPDASVQTTTGMLAVLAIVLTGLQTFLNLADEAAEHRSAAAKYEAVKRSAEFFIMKNPENKNSSTAEALEELDRIRKTLDELALASPTVPDRVYDTAVLYPNFRELEDRDKAV
jgi:hypothetical protein